MAGKIRARVQPGVAVAGKAIQGQPELLGGERWLRALDLRDARVVRALGRLPVSFCLGGEVPGGVPVPEEQVKRPVWKLSLQPSGYGSGPSGSSTTSGAACCVLLVGWWRGRRSYSLFVSQIVHDDYGVPVRGELPAALTLS